MKNLKKLIVAGICMLMIIPTINVKADSTTKYLALGANLTDEQKTKVLDLLGVTDIDEYKVITVTNDEEHQYLDGKVSSSFIGTKALSCASVEQTSTNGIQVSTQNITYCTSGMYQNALATAGVENAIVKVAGPFDISGTAALVGIMKAYESMSGETLSESSKEAATQELVTTGEVAQSIGSDEAEKLIADIKDKVLSNNITDADEIKSIIEESASDLNITLSDDDIEKIQSLMDKISKLDINIDQIKEQVENIYNQIKNNDGLWAKLKSWFNDVKSWLMDLLGL